MAVESRIARSYSLRVIIIGAVCLVLGLWGVYDYVIDIPRRQRAADQRAVLEQCQAALQTEQARGRLSPDAKEAVEAVDAELERVVTANAAEQIDLDALSAAAEAGEPVAPIQVEATAQEIQWIVLLLQMKAGLVSERQLPLTEERYPAAAAAYEASQQAIDEIGEVTAPGKYDRVTQWAFMLCLPFVPYYFAMYIVTRRRTYHLGDDGALVTPEGAWNAEDIADIDMSRWMAKSIATVEMRDGTRVKLDDYKYKDLYRIVGAIASRLYPDAWNAEAKPIDNESDDAAPEAGSEAPAAAEAAEKLS